MGLFGPPDVDSLKRKGKTDQLVKAIEYRKDPEIQRAAFWAVFDPFSSSNVARACEAAAALDDRALAIDLLTEALPREQPTLRGTVPVSHAAAALDQLGWQPTSGPAAAWYWVRKADYEQCAALGPVAFQPLRSCLYGLLKRERGSDACRVVRTLGAIGGPDAITLLTEYLQTSLGERGIGADVAEAARKSLITIGDEAVPALLNVLTSAGSRPAIPARTAATRAATALGAIGDDRAIEPLLTLARGSGDQSIRLAAIEALGSLHDERAHQLLTEMLDSHDTSIQHAALTALEASGRSAPPEATARYWATKEDWNRCIDIGTPAIDPLIEALERVHDRRAQLNTALDDDWDPMQEYMDDDSPGHSSYHEDSQRRYQKQLERDDLPNKLDHIAAALTTITGQSLGTDPDAWRTWRDAAHSD